MSVRPSDHVCLSVCIKRHFLLTPLMLRRGLFALSGCLSITQFAILTSDAPSVPSAWLPGDLLVLRECCEHHDAVSSAPSHGYIYIYVYICIDIDVSVCILGFLDLPRAVNTMMRSRLLIGIHAYVHLRMYMCNIKRRCNHVFALS